MEPNTSRSAAATSPAVIADHVPSSANAQSHLSPTSLLPQPSPSLASASASRSRSPAMAAGALSVHGHATWQPLPLSSSFPSLSAVQPEAPVADDQPWQGLAPPPSWTASGIPLCVGAFFLGFASLTALLEKIMAWVWRGEMLLAIGREPELIDGEDDATPDAEDAPLSDNFNGRALIGWDAALNITGSMQRVACHGPSSSMAIGTSSSMLTMSIGANKSSGLPPVPPPPPSSLRIGAGSSSARGVVFSEAEKEIIKKDKNLQELMKTDLKKVKRTLSNRIHSAKRKAFKDMHILELECQVATAQQNCDTLSKWLQLLKERCAQLETENKEMSTMAKELQQKVMLEDAVRETLQTQLQTLKHIKLNALQQTNPKLITNETSVSGAYGLHQRSGSHMNALHQQMNPHMVPLQPLQILQEQSSEHQQAQPQQQQHKDNQFMGEQQHPDV